jgi:hypothetical protein
LHLNVSSSKYHSFGGIFTGGFGIATGGITGIFTAGIGGTGGFGVTTGFTGAVTGGRGFGRARGGAK